MKQYYIYKMNLKIMTIFSFLLLFCMLLITSLCYKQNIFNISYYELLLFCLLLIPFMLFHEFLHALSYILHGAKTKNITYGVCLEKSILYCLCKQNITKKNILISLLSPFLVIGLFTYLIGLLLNNSILILLSIINITGCSGDFIMFVFIAKQKKIEFSEFDNPIAFAIYTKEDLSHKKMIGLEYIESKKTLKRNDLKKITISKASIKILIAWLILIVLLCLLEMLS